MPYIALTILLFIGMLVYFRIAERFNIVDKPKARSSHTTTTLRGGGVVFWLAALVYLVNNHHPSQVLFFAGITLIAAAGFWDDVRGLNTKIRLFFQLASVSLAFFMTEVFMLYPWWGIAVGYIVFVGILNAYNFMDGINGITGLYSLAVLSGLQYVNIVQIPFVNPDLVWYPMIAAVVFLFFNFREKARCFSGDAGSVSMAFWIVTLLLMLMIKTDSLVWIGFLLVYGVDSVLTILHRIYLKQNIFKAHRLHFYQILANEKRMSHGAVAFLYFVIQILCSFAIIALSPHWGLWVLIALVFFLIGIYSLKFKWLQPLP